MEKYELQKKYCVKKKCPMFAPIDTCYFCKKEIWEHISDKDAKGTLIKKCPICKSSFLD